jgi:putative FmdB family regulatory protein
MPTYEYECQKCGHRFDEFQSMKDAPLSKCPKCKGKLKRLIGAGAGFLFKGSGFYITDYRSTSYSDKKSKDAGAASGTSTPAAPPPASDKSTPATPKPAKESKESRAPKKSKA